MQGKGNRKEPAGRGGRKSRDCGMRSTSSLSPHAAFGPEHDQGPSNFPLRTTLRGPWRMCILTRWVWSGVDFSTAKRPPLQTIYTHVLMSPNSRDWRKVRREDGRRGDRRESHIP